MKAVFLACLVLSTGVWGCAASSAETDIDGSTPVDAHVDAPKKDGGSTVDTGTTSQCVPTCTADVDCQNSCPDVPNGINCCDTATGYCYANASQTCPEPIDAGFD